MKENIPKYPLKCALDIQTSGVIGGDTKIIKAAKILCLVFKNNSDLAK